ncbi:MAG: SpoIID/LytB domain-containing protein [Candidatus Wallbacteria bacterium]
MKKTKLAFILIIILILWLIPCINSAFASGTRSYLRVGVVRGAKNFSISNIDYAKSKEFANILRKARVPLNYTLNLEIEKNEYFKVSGSRTGLKKFKIYPKKDSFVKINGSPYRGNFEVYIKSGAAYVVNEISLEDYLKGVIACEMEPESELEALKAQAIVARTYTIITAGKHKSLGYDICSSTCCQVYKGVAHETQKTNTAVSQTAGMTIEYKGSPINSYYCSSCGGYTESVDAAWPGAKSASYLKVIRCPYCEKDDKVEWQYKISKREFISKMRSKGFEVSDITYAKVEDSTNSGRFYTLELHDNSGPLFMSTDEIRKIFGNNKIKSSYFKVSISGGSSKFKQRGNKLDEIINEKSAFNRKNFENSYIIFTGSGHGHGVGMCQNGAKKMAESGKSCREIIKFYFTDRVSISR